MLNELSQSLEKAQNHLRQEFAGIHIGRASATMVDEIQVESYGSMMPLKATANISCPDSQTVRVEPWDKSLVGAIEKAIIEADIGITPQNMGESILLPVPAMTEDRRKQVVKKVFEEAEHAKISIRNIRQDFLKKVKTQKDAKDISEDEEKRLEKKIQEKIDETNKTIEELSKKKEGEIMSI